MRRIQCHPYWHTYLRFILITSSHLGYIIFTGPSTSGLKTEVLKGCEFIILPMRAM